MTLFNGCENEKKTNNLLYIIIIALLIVVAIMAFFMGKNLGKEGDTNGGKETGTTINNGSSVTITVIDDKRCTNCMTKEILAQIKKIPFLAGAKFIEKDFDDKGVSDYLKDNKIEKLPAIILSSKDIDDQGEMQPYLKELADKQYSLEIGASFDPYAKRSAKGFLVMKKDVLEKVKSDTYLKGNKDAKITWIEYSDLECPFCAKLHNSDVPTKISETYKDDVNIYFNSFPLDFHKNAMPAARTIECLAEQKGAEAFYSLIEKSFKDEKSDKDFLVAEAVKLGANKANLEKCITDGKYDKKITDQQSFGSKEFGISGTPASIVVNNETLEYEVLSGAVPFSAFQTVIDKLLK